MNPRTTGILFLIAAALGAFVYFYEIRGEEGRLEAEARQKRLFPDVEADAIEWIELTSSDGRPVRAERRDKGWEIVQPLVFPGDQFALDGMASALAQITSEAVYEDPQTPEVYGLDDESRELRFAAGGVEHGLRTGDKTPMGSNAYAAVVGEKPVYAVPGFRVNSLRKAFDDLRDKRILQFDTTAVEQISASWPDGRVELAREEGKWRLTAPVEGPADADTVKDLLSDLSFLRASGFEDERLRGRAAARRADGARPTGLRGRADACPRRARRGGRRAAASGVRRGRRGGRWVAPRARGAALALPHPRRAPRRLPPQADRLSLQTARRLRGG